MPQDPNSDSKLTHLNADTDSSLTAIHHTLGAGPTQASPGSHRHDGTDSYRISATDIEGDIAAANGLPAGGLEGQILAKETNTDYDAIWIDNNGGTTSQVKHEVKLGENIAKGQAVYVSSSNGTNMIVSKASNTTDATSSKTLGLLETGGVTNDFVMVITEGLLAGLDTSTATAGDPVWLGTSGNLLFGTANKPVAPAHLVYLGVVTRVQSVNGEIFVHIVNGFELDELHDVLISSKTNGDLIKYDSASGLWKNAAQSTLTIAQSQVTGLTTDLAGKASTTHSATHMDGGSDPVYIEQAQVTGLTTALAGKASTTHAYTHLTGGADEIVIDIPQVAGLTTALAGKASTTHASTHASGGSDAITIAPAQVTGTAVITTDSRLSDARTPTIHSATHMDGGTDPIYIDPAQVTGTAVITTDSRLSDARTPTAHASTHASGGSDAITIAQSQVTNLTTALAGKASTTHSGTHSDGGSDPVYINPAQVTGIAVITTDSRLSNARTPTAHASTHASGGSDPVTVAQSQVTGLTTALAGKASTTHSATHSDGGSDPVYIEQAQVTGLTTALAGKASTSHASTHALGGGDSINISQSQVVGLVTALDGKASSTHVHGNISNTGTVSTSVTATNPVKVVITDSSNIVGTLTTTGASSSTFLRGDGVWGAVSGAIKIATNRTTSTTGTTALAVNAQESFAITFPSGRFSTSPSVTASTSSVRYVAAVTAVTTSGFTLFVRNVSDASGTTYLYHWQAIEVIS